MDMARNFDISDAYDRLIALLYEGTTQYDLWQDFLVLFNNLCCARDTSLVIILHQCDSAVHVLSTDKNPEINEDYINQSMKAGAFISEIPMPVPTTVNEIITENRFLKTRLYCEFFVQSDVRYLLFQDVIRTREVSVRITAKRSAKQGNFGIKEKMLFSRIVPHLRRALQMRNEHFNDHLIRVFLSDTVDKMKIGYMLLNRHGHILIVNSIANKILGDRVGLERFEAGIRNVEGMRGPNIKNIIQAIIRQPYKGRLAIQKENIQGFCIESSCGKPVLSVIVKRIDDAPRSKLSPEILIYMTDIRTTEYSIDTTILQKIYGFTRCESRLAVRLARGDSLDDAARNLHVSINTVRTHLRGIYNKLGINKQYKVTAVLNNSAARLV